MSQPTLRRRKPDQLDRAWEFELTPERLRWWKNEHYRNPALVSWWLPKLIVSFLIGVAIPAVPAAIFMKEGTSWREFFLIILSGPSLLIGSFVGLVSLIVGYALILGGIPRQGKELEIDTTTGQCKIVDSRFILGKRTTIVHLENIRSLRFNYRDYGFENPEHDADLSYQDGQKIRKVGFFLKIRKREMEVHRRWLIGVLGEERVPPPLGWGGND